MPSFNGYPLFGRSVNIKMVPNPSKKQYTEFFGLNGVYSLFGGTRGRVFFASGVLVAADAAALSTVIGTILSYDDGKAYQLVDTLGNVWPEVQFERFEPGGRFMVHNGLSLVDYRWTLTGLI